MKKQFSSQLPDTIDQNFKFLQSLKTKSFKKQHKFLKLATSQELLSLVEIALNIVRSRFRLTGRQRTRLLPYANFVRKLSRSRTERGARQILQKGAGIPLTALITPIILEAIRYLATKN